MVPATPRAVQWVGGPDGHLRLIDQTRLPGELVHLDCRTADAVWQAIKRLSVRGAPAIGIAAAYGVVVGVQPFGGLSAAAFRDKLVAVADYLRTSRPTAVNLFWALDRMERLGPTLPADPAARVLMLLDEAQAIEAEDRAMCLSIGRHGAAVVPEGGGVLTHCNAGGLATADYGTALAALYAAHHAGKRFKVFADETRPLLQGARLTAWELQQAGIDVTLICDSMAGQVMREGRVGAVIVGADRIAANGDAANKIGTYSVAVLAKHHGIPFYVAAPSSTFDLMLPDGSGIPIEQRDPREITHGFGVATAPEGVTVYNPAFDVTPAGLIAGLITEKGLIQPVTAERIAAVIA